MLPEVEQIQKQILPLLKDAGVLRSSIFGSVVRGEATPTSDVDILVELPRNKNMFDLMDLQNKIALRLNKEVDLVTYRSLHHLLRDRILEEQVQIL